MEADGFGEKTKVLKIKPIVHLIEEWSMQIIFFLESSWDERKGQ